MISLFEIESLTDLLLLPWLDLYETAFPPGERVLVSRVLDVLYMRARGDRGRHLLAVVNPENSLVGIVFDYEPEGGEAAFLWYFAIDPQMRGHGLGAQVYKRLLERLGPQVRALIFDLEDPTKMETPEAVSLAERRVAFYRRLGARLLGGIEYIQFVAPHLPPLPLLLMAHPIREISPQEAFDLARAEFGEESLKQVGELRWK